jgi:hypothetical protein
MAAAAGAFGQPPLLVLGQGEAAQVDAMNEWARRVDASLGLMSGAFSDMRAEIVNTQAVLVATVQDAKVALGAMHEGFRAALETHGTTQRSLTEALVLDARVKFEDLDRKLAVGMSQMEQWALGEGARTAQLIAGASNHLIGTPEGSPQPSPRLPPAADPWGQWRPPASFGPASRQMQRAGFEAYPGSSAAAAAAGPAPAAAASQDWLPPEAPRVQPPTAPQWGGAGGPHAREFRIDPRGWSSHQKALDAGMSPEAFQIWRERALVHLSQGRQDVRRLLVWAEGETAAEVRANAGDATTMQDFALVNFALHGAIMQVIGDSLLGRARCSDEHGVLLWRNLCAEWAGSAPQYRHAKAKQFQDPPRAKDMAALWAALPAWERLGEEVRTAGFDVPEWVKSAALEKLLPVDLLRTLISRPELDSLASRLAWVRSQMEHARGSAQMLALAGGGRGKDAGGDVLMGALAADSHGADSLVWSLQAERGRVELEGDWARAAALSEAINALGKGGKSKGYGKGNKGGKGAPAAWSSAPAWGSSKGTEKGSKGGNSGDAAAGTFSGACHHCGVVGHRKRDCRKLDAEMASRRQGGLGGGKGGGKGGKGIYECGEGELGDEEGAQDGANGASANADEVWWFDTLGFLGSDPAPAQRRPAARPPQPHPAPRRPGLKLRNSFAALGEAEPEETRFSTNPHGMVPFSTPHSACCGDCLHGCRNPIPQDLVGSRPAAPRGLRAPRPTGVPRRVAESSGWLRAERKRAGKQAALSLLLEDSASGDLLATLGRDSKEKVRIIEVVVDSGAVQSVAPLGLFPGVVEPSEMSKAGRTYRAANGSPIRNLGQVRVPFVSDEGHRCSFPFQVAEVEHALLSVAHLAAAGNRVELHDAGGTITHKATGKQMALVRRGGVYVLRLRVSGFPRPVAK